jgi:monoterpene epsilon-lactone hydrolase
MRDPEIAALREKLAQRVRPTDIAERRKSFDAFASTYRTPPDIVVEPITVNGVPAEWTTAPDVDHSRAVLYLHGGGYVIGSLDSHRHLAAEVGRTAGARCLALHYRLAPEYPFPAAVDDALAGYRYMLDAGIAPGHIAIAGDSAGGGLVVAALLAIRDAGLPQPAAGWCISPWVDMDAIGASMTGKASEDPTVQKEPLLEMAAHYLHGTDPRAPLAAPIYADLRDLAPLFIQVGSVETLLDDAIRLARVAGAAHVPVTLEIWPEMVHVWHLYYPDLAAGRRAIAAGGRFLHDAMRAA